MQKYGLFFCLFIFFSHAVFCKSSLTVLGLDNKEKQNVELYLSNIDNPMGASEKQIISLVSDALKALGYYHPVVTIESDNDTTKVISVTQGSRVKIVAFDIIITGEANKDSAFQALIDNSHLATGKPLNHGYYDNLKSGLTDLAFKRGYFDAKMTTSQLLVDPTADSAYITMVLDSGRRYQFGETLFTGSQINVKKLYALLPYEMGDPYLITSVGLLNQRLANVGWFSSVFAGANVEKRSEDQVPVNVVLIPQDKNKMETGIGFTTNTGPRLKFKWRKPWINSAGHSLNLQTEISQYQPTLQLAYKIPLLNVLEDYYQMTGGIRYVDIHDTVSTNLNFGVERHWTLGSWDQVLFMRWLYEDYKQGAFEEGVANMGVVGLSYGHYDFKGGVMPTNAQKSYFSLGYSDGWLGAESPMFMLHAKQGWIRRLSERQRGVLRLDAGAVTANKLEDIPPMLRFFIGGDNSIRGYSYQSVAPEDSEGKLRGGQYMATASVEYQYNVWGNWWGAMFFDYGSSWYQNPDFVRGTGVGVRWASPIGAIRLDIGWGLDRPDTPYEIHFTLGPEL